MSALSRALSLRPLPVPADSNRAIFLSYASQDAEAARRICEALRAEGVEVWFDADGGLGSVSTAEVNSSDVRSALEEFADNWDDKRTETSKSLSSLAEMVGKAVETFTEADKELAAKAREILEQRQTQQTSQEAAQGRERDRIETGQTS